MVCTDGTSTSYGTWAIQEFREQFRDYMCIKQGKLGGWTAGK